jgi:nickel transport protein
MRCLKLCFLALVLVLMLTSPATAHRVNIFAFMDGADIRVECYFGRAQPIQGGKITVLDAAENTVLLEGTTDEQGAFRFPAPPALLEQEHDLVIRVNAGGGHQNEWRVLAASLDKPVLNGATSDIEAPGDAKVAHTHSGQFMGVHSEELEQIINTALEKKLAPIRQILAEQAGAAPSWREIIGGIGWIVGLVGLVAYFKSRRA